MSPLPLSERTAKSEARSRQKSWRDRRAESDSMDRRETEGEGRTSTVSRGSFFSISEGALRGKDPAKASTTKSSSRRESIGEESLLELLRSLLYCCLPEKGS